MAAAARLLPVLLLALLPHCLAAPKEIVIATYNVENYLGPEPAADGGKARGKPKTERAIEAVIRVVKEISPDVLGVCEMGSPERFEDFKKRLVEAGLGYADSEYLQAVDVDRHLALLSRFPIIARNSQ